jgi:hypothetical protein
MGDMTKRRRSYAVTHYTTPVFWQLPSVWDISAGPFTAVDNTFVRCRVVEIANVFISNRELLIRVSVFLLFLIMAAESRSPVYNFQPAVAWGSGPSEAA